VSNSEEEPGDRSELTWLARDLLGAHPDAEDVSQEAWLLYQREPPGRVRSVGAWLRVALRHLARRSRQRDRLRAQRERVVARPEQEPSVLEHLERKAQAEFLLSLIEALGEPYRQVVRLRYLEDREIDEIAARLGRSQATVRSQLKRGLDQLRVRLGDESARRRLLSLVAFGRRRPFEGRGRARGSRRPALVAGVGASALLLAFVLFRERATPVVHVASATPLAPIELDTPVVLTPAPGGREPLLLAPTEVLVEANPRAPGGIEVAGRVLRVDGSPLPGAAILVGSKEDVGRTVTHSDAQGRYELHGVEAQLHVWAEAPESLPSARHWIGSKPSGRALDLRLHDSMGMLSGRIIAFDGRPAPDAEIVLRGATDVYAASDQGTLALSLPDMTTSTTIDGRFSFDRRPENYRLFVRAEGHAPFVWKSRDDAGGGEIEIALPRPSALQGSVLRPDGRPAAGARLRLSIPKAIAPYETTADADGLYRFEALPAGPYALQLVEPLADTDASCFEEGELAVGERAWRMVTLVRGLTIYGRVLDGETPVARWIVEVQTADRRGYARDLRRTETAADGSFAFPSCSVGKTNFLRLFEPGATNDIPRGVVWEVEPGNEAILSLAELRPVSLAGHFLKSPSGLLPSIAVLRGKGLSAPLPVAVDSESGAFSVPSLPTGEHVVRGWVPEVGVWRAGSLSLSDGTTEHRVQVPEPGRLVLRPEPPPSDRKALTARVLFPSLLDLNLASSYQALTWCAEGDCLETILFPGTYDLTVLYRGIPYESLDVRIDEGATRTVDLALREVVPMALELHAPHRLERERVTLCFHELGQERNVEAIQACTTRTSDVVRILVSPDATELEASAGPELNGRLVFEPGDIVPNGTLSLTLRAKR
jgi:RNA polymerase sigma-70 factor (ECF subfamily)